MIDFFDLEPSQGGGQPHETAWRFREARIVQVALRLGLFAALATPKSVAQLCDSLESDPEMTERLLIVLAALGLVKQDGDIWRNDLVAQLHLVPDSPLYQGAEIERANATWDLFHHLERLVRKGRNDAALRALRERIQQRDRWQQANHVLALAGQAQRLARVVRRLAGRRHLLDVGGAPGSYSIALCQRFPALRTTLMETDADSVGLCQQMVTHCALEARITVTQWAWQRQRWGDAAYDALLLNQILVGSESQALTRLARAYRALEGGGLLIVQGHFLNNDLRGPEEAAQRHLLRGTYTLNEISSLIGEAGFERIQLQHRGPPNADILTAQKPLDDGESEVPLMMAYVSPEQELFDVGSGASESSLSRQQELLTTIRR
ncbi:MAG: hypothetical protein KDD73_13920 [Anaerolineales bacterium]|nr:hypothetical protein [Anaerolineales bacterium]MCB9127894.1 hypothetical protein [Ardenticatenales bacterium]MCB9171656.1 hypothetical protein [Ardenticatenales bacterium]